MAGAPTDGVAGRRFPGGFRDVLIYDSVTGLGFVGLGVWFIALVSADVALVPVGAMLIAFGASFLWLDSTHVRANWIGLGESCSTLSVDGERCSFTNESVTWVHWTKGHGLNSTNIAHRPTVIRLTVEGRRRDVELIVPLGSRRRALVLATEAFTEAEWTYDQRILFGLVPPIRWGPGEPVPGMRVRDLWRNRKRP